jgi:hypothetical protein
VGPRLDDSVRPIARLGVEGVVGFLGRLEREWIPVQEHLRNASKMRTSLYVESSVHLRNASKMRTLCMQNQVINGLTSKVLGRLEREWIPVQEYLRNASKMRTLPADPRMQNHVTCGPD